MAEMDKLPEELVSRILQDLPSEGLGAIPTVNKKLCRIATPFLYSKCDLTDSKRRDQYQAVRCLMRTFMERPELRSLPQEICIGDWRASTVSMSEYSLSKLSIKDVDDILRSIPFLRKCVTRYHDRVARRLLGTPSQDAMTVAILCMLPDLRRVTLSRDPARNLEGVSYEGRDTLTFRMIELSGTGLLNGSSLLQHVSHVSVGSKVGSRLDSTAWDVSLVFKCLRLPALKTFVGAGCIDTESPLPQDIHSSATEVILSDCAIQTKTIQRLLRSCRDLTTFKCQQVCYYDAPFRPCNYSYAELHKDLFHHRQSIRYLSLHAKSCGHSNRWASDPIESFTDLAHLKSLEVDEDALFGNQQMAQRHLDQILPTSLEHVVVKVERNTDQTALYQKICLALISGGLRTTFELHDARIKDAEEVVKGLQEIKLQEITDRYEVVDPDDDNLAHPICSFLISKRKEEALEA